MSRTLKEKQQAFRQKLQTEGADSFADGPHPWEQWDESGNQHDNRVWEGTARRIHPQHRRTRGFGDRLLSGLAVVALASMVVGIVGIYFSTPTTLSTTQQARTVIQPPPIVASRMNAPPAMQPDEPADTAAPVLANLDTLSPPAAGTPAARDEYQAVLEPVVTAPGTAPAIPSDSIDSVAVETVITEEAVTTTVYTRQLSQDEPELVAMVATTAPPFTHDPIQNDAPSVDTEPAAVEQAAEVVTEPTVVAQAEITDIEPAVAEEASEVVTEPTVVAQAEITDIEPAVAEEASEAVTEPTILAQAEIIDTEPAVVEEAAEVATESTVAAQAEIADIEPAVVEESAETVTEPMIVAQAKIADTDPTAVKKTGEVVTEPIVVAQAEIADTDPAAVEKTGEVVTEPTVVAQAEIADTDPAAVEKTGEVATKPTVAAQAETVNAKPAIAEETAKPAAAVVAVNTTVTAAEAAPDITRELETATEIPVPPKTNTGKWVINLSSYTRKPTAERMLAVFQKKGVANAEVFTTIINDKPMHRIRVTGFENARSAKAEISALEQQLGLEGTWASKR